MAGAGADDSLVGGAGNDTLDGGAARTAGRGADDDTYLVNSFLDVVMEDPSGGFDTVVSEDNYTLPSDFENLTLTARPSAPRATRS